MSIARPTMAQTERNVRDLTTSAAAGGQQAQVLSYLQNKLAQLTMSGQAGTPEHFIVAGEIQALKNAAAKAQLPPANPRPVIADLLPTPLTPTPVPQGMPAAATPQTPAPEDAGGIAAMEAPNMETIDMMGGGLVAFGDGGEVPRYQNQGIVEPINRLGLGPEEVEANKLRGEIARKYRWLASPLGSFQKGSSEAKEIMQSLPNLSLDELRQLNMGIPASQPGGATQADVRRGDVLEMAPAAGLPAVAAAGTPAAGTPAAGAPAAGDQPTVRLKSDDTSGLPAIVAPTYGDAMALGRQFAGSTADIEKQLKELPTEKQAAQSQFDVYKEMGVDLDPYKSLKASLEKEKSEEGKAKTEAGLMRLAEFGFNWASQTGPALQAAAKAGKEVAPGMIGDLKELKKLSRERERTMADIAAVDSKMRKDVTDAGLAKLQKRRESLEKRRDEINDNAARIGGTIYGQQLASQTQMATTGMTTRATIAKLEQQLGTDRAAKIVGIAEKLLAQNKMYPAMTPAEQDAAFKQAVQQAMSGMATAETTVTPRS